MEIKNAKLTITEIVRGGPDRLNAIARVRIMGNGWGSDLNISLVDLMKTLDCENALDIKDYPVRVKIEENITRNVGNFLEDKWVWNFDQINKTTIKRFNPFEEH